MSVLSTLFCGWLAFNAVLFAALYFSRPNPKLRAKLFSWVVRGPHNRRAGATRQAGDISRMPPARL
jgi:hypothetical protein